MARVCTLSHFPYIAKRSVTLTRFVMASINTFYPSSTSVSPTFMQTSGTDQTDGSQFKAIAATHATHEEVKYLLELESRMNRLVNPADRSSFCTSIAVTWCGTLLSDFLGQFLHHLQPVMIGIGVWHRFAIDYFEQSPEEIFYTHAERSSGVDGSYRFDPILTAIPDQIEIYEKLRKCSHLIGSGHNLPIDLGGLQHRCSHWKVKQKDRQLICKLLLNRDFPVHEMELQEPPLMAGDS